EPTRQYGIDECGHAAFFAGFGRTRRPDRIRADQRRRIRQHHALEALRMPCRERDARQAAHRQAAIVRALDVERVEQTDHVAYELLERGRTLGSVRMALTARGVT